MRLALSLSDVVIIMLINFKMPTIVDILTFMSMINFVLSWVEHGKSFIASDPGCFTLICSCCHVTVNVLRLFLAVPWVGL